MPETGELLNSLFWDQPVDPLEWQPNATAFARLDAVGVHTSVVSKREFAGSGLTRCGQRGAAYVGADDIAERIAGAVAGASQRPSLTYVYDGDLDWHGHRAGVDSERWRAQLRDIDEDVQELREALPEEVRLLVVADHGMVDSSKDTHIDIDATPELRDGVTLVGGEARFRHVYCHGGAVDEVAATWRETLGDRATVLTRDEAIERGWFGRVDPNVRLRLGDVVAAAHDSWALMSSKDFPYEMTLIGLHGSLTPTGDAHPDPGLLTTNPSRMLPRSRGKHALPVRSIARGSDRIPTGPWETVRRTGAARPPSRRRVRGQRSSGGGGGRGRGPRSRPLPAGGCRRRRRRSPRPR